MRQLGGSFGISLVNTYVANRNAVHRTDIISHITMDNPLVVQRLSGYTKYFMTKGFTVFDARSKALKLLDLTVVKQAAHISYSDAYLLIGMVFLLAIPLLLLSGKRKGPIPVIVSDH